MQLASLPVSFSETLSRCLRVCNSFVHSILINTILLTLSEKVQPSLHFSKSHSHYSQSERRSCSVQGSCKMRNDMKYLSPSTSILKIQNSDVHLGNLHFSFGLKIIIHKLPSSCFSPNRSNSLPSLYFPLFLIRFPFLPLQCIAQCVH